LIQYITGVLGHGKSLWGARHSAQTLLSGRALLSNIELGRHEGRVFIPGEWQHEVLRHSPYYRFGTKSSRAYMRREIDTRYQYEPDFEKLVAGRLKGYGEGRGRRIFDEAHNNMNNRDWKDMDQNMVLRRLSLSRKRGWDDAIISQHAKNTDVSIRRIADSEIRIVDWQKIIKIPIFHAKLLPFHMFLAQTFPIEESAVPGVMSVGKRTSSEVYFLGWWRAIYDTFADYEFDDELDSRVDVITLPKPMAALVAVQGGRAGDEPQAKSGALHGDRLELIQSAGGHELREPVPPDGD